MRSGLSNRGGLIVAVGGLMLAGIATQLPYAAVLLLAVAVFAVLGSVAHDAACGHLPAAHVVYRLVDRHGATLYIGSTNDLARRLDEHTDGGGDPWRRHIHAAVEHRLTVSERQARRIEERMIRALTMGVDAAFCAPLHNETWTAPTSNPLTKAWARMWMWVYVAQSLVFRGCAWAHPNGLAGYVMLAEHRPDACAEWDDDEPAEDAPVTADYQRSPYPPAPPYEMIALGPVTPSASSDASADSDPPLLRRGDHNRDAPDADGGQARTTPRNARRGNVRTVNVNSAHAGPANPSDAAELLAQRRAADAERKRRARAEAKKAQQP